MHMKKKICERPRVPGANRMLRPWGSHCPRIRKFIQQRDLYPSQIGDFKVSTNTVENNLYHSLYFIRYANCIESIKPPSILDTYCLSSALQKFLYRESRTYSWHRDEEKTLRGKRRQLIICAPAFPSRCTTAHCSRKTVGTSIDNAEVLN